MCSVRFDFYTELQAKLQTPAKVVPVFDKVKMQGERGAVATVDMPQGLWPHCCEITSLVAKPELKNHFIPTRKPPGKLLLPKGLLNLRPLGGICIFQGCGKPLTVGILELSADSCWSHSGIKMAV